VTSDAIAGRLAVVLHAQELVLIKSVPPPIAGDGDARLQHLADAGFVDAFLPKLRAELPRCRVVAWSGAADAFVASSYFVKG
jgi:hypothetical protein